LTLQLNRALREIEALKAQLDTRTHDHLDLSGDN
jgi:hypothetical protein